MMVQARNKRLHLNLMYRYGELVQTTGVLQSGIDLIKENGHNTPGVYQVKSCLPPSEDQDLYVDAD